MMTELHQFTALNHLFSSYIATLSLYKKEHAFVIANFEDLKPTVQNTIYLLNLAIENLRENKGLTSNVPLIRMTSSGTEDNQNDEAIISEQIDLIQKVAYDIFKLSEKIKI